MKEFAGRIAVVTGGGSGMGRELVRQLVAEACNVSMCDLAAEGMAETVRLCETAGLPQGLRVTTHIADVSDFAQMERFRTEVADRHATDRIHLLFNNAGIGGGSSLIVNSCEEWERTFNVCWGSVYNGTRAFLPLLLKAEEGHIVNTSSVNGFWASIGPHLPQTAYAAAKFAVKGFTEALITDLRINAPHIKCSVVMPGHIGTSIPLNTRKVQSGNQADAMDATQLAQARARFASMGRDASAMNRDGSRIVRLGYKDCQRNLGNSGWQGLAFALDPARHGERRQGCPRRTHEARNPHEASTQPGRSCLRYGWSAV